MRTSERETEVRAERARVPSLYELFWGSFANGMRRMARWRKQGLLRKSMRERRARVQARFEPLEPRLLLSADLSYTAIASGDLTLRTQDVGGVETLQLVDSSDPGMVLASEALANIDGSSGYGARIDANGFDLDLTIDATAEAAGVNGGIVYDGGAGNSTLKAPDAANTFILSGDGAGSVGSVSFSGVEHLIGGDGEEDRKSVV